MRTAILLFLGVALAANPAAAGHGRERAVELIPELMGRILESQEEIRADKVAAAKERIR